MGNCCHWKNDERLDDEPSCYIKPSVTALSQAYECRSFDEECDDSQTDRSNGISFINVEDDIVNIKEVGVMYSNRTRRNQDIAVDKYCRSFAGLNDIRNSSSVEQSNNSNITKSNQSIERTNVFNSFASPMYDANDFTGSSIHRERSNSSCSDQSFNMNENTNDKHHVNSLSYTLGQNIRRSNSSISLDSIGSYNSGNSIERYSIQLDNTSLLSGFSCRSFQGIRDIKKYR
ncbi:hypothetical protein ACF0H5_024303 [Mactra antiquata]